MDILEKFIRKVAYKFPKGYPDINNPEDRALLFELLEKQQLREEEGDKETEDYTYEDLLKLIQTKKDVLDPKFIQKLYHTIESKGQKLGTYIQKVFDTKKLKAASSELFGIIQQYPGLEKQLVDILKDQNRQITIDILKNGDNIIDIAQEATRLPADFLRNLVKAGKAAEGGKGVGEGEALLALLGRDAKKMDIGDVELQGQEVEMKGTGGRLIGRGENLVDLYSKLAKLGVGPRKAGSGAEALHTYIPYILKTNPEVEKEIKDLLKKEFKTSFDIDLTSSEAIKTALLEWYVDYFLANEGKTANYIMIIIGENYKFLNREEFKQAILSGDIAVKNFAASNKSPNIIGFT